MAYGQSHRIEYKDSADIDTRIEIWERDYVGAVLDCEAAEDPLNVDIAPMDPTIYIPVIGCGATITILSVTEGQHRGLYTKDPTKRLVKIFKDNKANPWFLGLVNPEQYSEPYSRSFDYPVNITVNNGLNALRRFKYIDGTTKYSTLETYWNILTRILAKTCLPFQYLYFATDVICPGINPAAGETIWHHLKANQLNYYDEQDEPMSYRAVLEAILSAFGLQCRQEEGSIFIYKPSMLAGASYNARRFNGTTYVYIDTVAVSRNFDISSGDINWDNIDQGYDIRGGFNRQKIRYSPYVPEGAIPEIDITDRENWTGPAEEWFEDPYGIWRLIDPIIPLRNINGILFQPYLRVAGHKKDQGSPDEEIYLERSAWGSGNLWFIIDGNLISAKNGRILAITGEVYIRTKDNEYDSAASSVVIDKVIVPITLEVGGYRFVGASGSIAGWEFESVNLPFGARIYKSSDETTLADTWLPFTIIIQGTWIPAGAIAILKAWDPDPYASNVKLDADDGMKNARMRNFKCRCYKSTSTERNLVPIDEDPEYSITLDDDFINDAPDITLHHADAVNITDRGAIFKKSVLDDTWVFTDTWQKEGEEPTYRLVDILLRSIASQYQDSLSQLAGTIEADSLMGVNGGPIFLHTLQDTDYLGNIKHLFTGGKYNDFKRTLNGSWLEVKQDDLTVTVES